MSGPWKNIEGVLLGATPHERFTRWEVFSSADGIVGVQVPAKKALPFGLFDSVAVHASAKGKTLFADDVRLISRPTALATHPDGFAEAGHLVRFVLELFRELPDFSSIYETFAKALGYYAAGLPPTLVTLKSLYKMLAAEGFPVGEDWLATLPASLRVPTIAALEAPLAATTLPPPPAALTSLTQWAQRELGTRR